MKMKHYILFVSIFSLLALMCVLVIFTEPREQMSQTEESYWEQQINTLGGVGALEKFADAVVSLNANEQHLKAHMFGGALYDQLGAKGISVCDTRFSYGCFHELLGRAIAELGLSSLAELNDVCIDRLGEDAHFCQHGLGHGIQTYFGYTQADVRDAMRVCKDLPHNDAIGGCAGGIFMEYNFRTMLAEDGEVRQDDNIFTPCDTLEKGAMSSCFFWQSEWWYAHLSHNEMYNDFHTLGKYCEKVVNKYGEAFRELCFRGIGNVTPQASNFNLQKSRQLCAEVSDTAQDVSNCIQQAETFF